MREKRVTGHVRSFDLTAKISLQRSLVGLIYRGLPEGYRETANTVVSHMILIVIYPSPGDYHE